MFILEARKPVVGHILQLIKNAGIPEGDFTLEEYADHATLRCNYAYTTYTTKELKIIASALEYVKRRSSQEPYVATPVDAGVSSIRFYTPKAVAVHSYNTPINSNEPFVWSEQLQRFAIAQLNQVTSS